MERDAGERGAYEYRRRIRQGLLKEGGSRAEMSRRKAATQAGQVVGAFETRLLTGG